MKIAKLLIVAVIAIFTFGSAEAQIIVKTGPRHPRKVVVVKKHARRHHRHAPMRRDQRHDRH